MDCQKGKSIGEGKSLSSFFFTEFLDSFDRKDMFKVFKEYELVMEVFIPSRRDRCGKRYGFVRFRKVVDKRIMAVKLDSIHIQGKKIFANISRF